MSKKRRASRAPPTPEPTLGGLASALASQGFTASERPSVPATAEAKPHPAPTGALRGKVVVRRERKGHGGKTVTVIEGAALRTADRPALARALRKALGCGAREAGETVVVQGDQRDAAAAWLEARGARVILGN